VAAQLTFAAQHSDSSARPPELPENECPPSICAFIRRSFLTHKIGRYYGTHIYGQMLS
jgi:hypothetical protein